MPGGTFVAPNITPSPSTGIGNWTKEQFIAKFKSYSDPSALQSVGEKDSNTIMPWSMYGQMTENDLGAIYAYLKTVLPVENKIIRWTKN